MEELNAITEKIIGAAYTVSNILGCGFLEKVYENAMFLEIVKLNLSVLKQKPLHVFYDDQIVGEYFADLMVEEEIIVEIKAIKELNEIHQAQLMNYLVACNKRCGLLINFGKPRVEIKRMLNGY
ncbi:GxxExxY protein [Pedobacter sp. WC2501]|uniref:GxxExxY protein n=1 Tax=Pedobacter sp. WC2501 TaxID=3461400 RepID=UPI0040459865